MSEHEERSETRLEGLGEGEMALGAKKTILGEEVRDELQRGVLGLRDIIVASLANIAPALGLYFSVALIAGDVGKAVPMAVVFGAIGLAFTAYTLSRFARAFPSVGSFVSFVTKGLGGGAGVTFGIVIEIGYLLLQTSTVIALGFWSQSLLQRWFSVNVPWQIIAIVGAALLYLMMIIGIKVTVHGALILFASEVVVLFVLAGFVLAHGGAQGISLTPFTFHSTNGTHGFALAFVLALYMFIGWEASVAFSEETRNPRRNVPISLFTTLGIAVLIYVFMSWVAVVGFGPGNAARLGGDSAPYDTLARIYAGGWLRFLVDIAGFTSICGSLLAAVSSQARILFDMGRIGMLPRLIGRSHPRFKTPHVALLTYFGFNVVCILIWGSLVNGGINVYGQVATLGSIPLVVIYMAVNLSAIVFVIRGGKLYRLPAVGIVVALLGVASMLYPMWLLIGPGQAAPFKYFPWAILALAIIAAFYAVSLMRKQPNLADEVDKLLVE